MTQFEFDQAIKELETIFKPLDEDQRKIYFDYLKKFDEYEFKETIEYLIETSKYFPKIADFFSARDEMSREQSSATAEEIESYCEKCSGEGRYIEEYTWQDKAHFKEVFCSCQKGQRMKRLREKYFQKHGRGYRAELHVKEDKELKESIEDFREAKKEYEDLKLPMEDEEEVPF